MKSTKYFGVALLGFALSTTSIFAHHEGTPLGALEDNAEYLNQTVTNSWLSYRVKNTVFAFVKEVEHLAGCVDTNPNNELRHHDGDISTYCLPQLQRVRSAFDGVIYYLYDAWDVPNVYQAYQATRTALYAVH